MTYTVLGGTLNPTHSLTLALRMEWYNGLITPQVHSNVTKRKAALPTDRRRSWNKRIKQLPPWSV